MNECPICHTYHNVGNPPAPSLESCMFTYTTGSTRGAVQIAGQAVSAERARCARLVREWPPDYDVESSVQCYCDQLCDRIAQAIERGDV